MNQQPLAIVILAAGKGTRMKSDKPKVMHELAGKPMINWLLDTVQTLSPEKVVVVIGPDMDSLAAAVAPHETVVQQTRNGTGGALKCALPALKGFKGDVLVLLGDAPLMSLETLETLVAARHGNDAAILGCHVRNSYGYGRLISDAAGNLLEIVEEKDADPDQKRINIINTGAFCLDAQKLQNWCERITDDNAQNEFYITQIPALIHDDGGFTAVAITRDEDEILGCNTHADLAVLENIAQQRLRNSLMNDGVSMRDPGTVYLWHDTNIGAGTIIEPNVVFGPKVTIAENVMIKAFSHIEESIIETGASIGPFARLRGGNTLAEKTKIGNFVELKNTKLGQGTKANHLTYLGDATLGENTNIGAGTITCNYNGFDKNKTTIGDNVFIGSNSALVAPITINDGAMVAAGSTITKNVEPDALSIARAEEKAKPGWAAKFRKLKSKK